MKYILSTALLAASTAQAAIVGNGKTTNSIKFVDLPGPYTFQRATAITPNGPGMCTLGEVSTASGKLGPLRDEMHHIFRGPIDLKQFAVYYPNAAKAKREATPEPEQQLRGRINHLDKHKQKRAHGHGLGRRVYGEWVTATINGQVVSFVDDWSQPPATPVAAPVAAPAAQVTPEAVAPAVALQQPNTKKAAPTSASASETVSTVDPNADWQRIAYYNSSTKHAENIVFTSALKMTNQMFLGFLPTFVAADGTSPAQSPQVINGFVPDNHEVIITSAASCNGDDSGGCSVVTPGIEAYHGFKGDRVVIMEYTMPRSTCGGSCANAVTGANYMTDRPAIWALNSNVVNIAQYGFTDPAHSDNNTCSGWAAGAGEFDIHEILPGDEPLDIGYASFQMRERYAGTNPEGLVRPTDPSRTQKLAYIVSGDYAGIHVLGSDFDIDEGLDAADIQSLMGEASPATNSKVKVSSKIAASGQPAYPVDQQSSTYTPTRL